MRHARWFFVATAAALFLSFSAATARAQVAQAQIRGTVMDESGAALPGVHINATHMETGGVRTAVTTASGTYIIPSLPVGTYRLTLDLTGFQTLVQEGSSSWSASPPS